MDLTGVRERPGVSAPELLATWSERTRVRVEVWTPDSLGEAGDGVVAALREALAAVEEGPRPSAVAVAYTTGAGGARLTFSHDGPGWPWAKAREAALSAIFRERGGRMSVNHVPGGGTTLTGMFPPA